MAEGKSSKHEDIDLDVAGFTRGVSTLEIELVDASAIVKSGLRQSSLALKY